MAVAVPSSTRAGTNSLTLDDTIAQELYSPEHNTAKTHATRFDGWNKCEHTGPGSCTVYMASADGSSSRLPAYRTAVLFDSECRVSQAVSVSLTHTKITLQGPPAYVDLYVDTSARPVGFLSYLGRQVPLGDMPTMTCHKFEGTDGVACRVAFNCS